MTTPTTTPATDQTTATAVTPPGVSEAAIFAKEHAKGAAHRMLGALDEIGRNAARITKIALGVSMPHQISYLLGLVLPYMRIDTSGGWTYTTRDVIHLLGMLLLVGGAPIVADLLIVSCIKVIGQPAASSSSKKGAMWIMLVPVAASVTVNVLAPAPHPILRVLAGFVVGVIPASEILRFLVRPDFAKIEAMEFAVEAQLARRVDDAAAVEQTVTTPDTPDQKQLNKQRMVAAQKARDLAAQAPDMGISTLMRATGCGRGAAKKALELVREAQAVAV